jgi:hypothetical protein
VQVYWIRPSPNVQAVLTQENRDNFDKMGVEIAAEFRLTGKKDLEVIPMHTLLADGNDYVDSDHLTAQGHRKLAQAVAARLGLPAGEHP